MLKKEKGITLISLIVYVIALTMLVAVIANVSRSFYKNMSEFSDSDSIELKFTQLNTFFLREINSSDTYISLCTGSNIRFSDGTQYLYKEGAVYYQTNDKNIKICDGIKNCTFQHNGATGVVSVNISDGTNDKTIHYKKN